MSDVRKLLLAAALAAGASVAWVGEAGACCYHGGYRPLVGAVYGPPVMVVVPSYGGYPVYGAGPYGGYYGGYGGYYGGYSYGRYSGRFRTDASPLTGGGY